MNEPPARAIASITHYVHQVAEDTAAEAVEDHERRCHAIPPPDRSPLTAIPFANYIVTDDQISHAIEMLTDDQEDCDDVLVSRRLGIPLPALQRTLADYVRRHGRFLYRRATVD